MLPKSVRNITNEKYTEPISSRNIEYTLKIGKLKPAVFKKDTILQLSTVYPRNARLAQHLKN